MEMEMKAEEREEQAATAEEEHQSHGDCVD